MLTENQSLQPYNTFGIEAKARWFARIQSMDELRSLLQLPEVKQQPKLILGQGSNVLLHGDFDGLVIKNELTGVETLDENEDRVTLRVQSGENWHALVQKCAQLDYGGIENLALIPGTCGAAPIQNIGAYGVEIKEVIDEVHGMDIHTHHMHTFSNEACAFGYRESVFKHAWREKFFISSITLTLTKKSHPLRIEYGAIREVFQQRHIQHPTIQDVRDAVVSIRESKLPDPRVIGNAGSFFKNPTIGVTQYQSLQKSYGSVPGYATVNQNVKIPAAWLIEQCGWKGKRVGRVGVHVHQALVLVHYGGAQGEEIFSLARAIMKSVKEKFDVDLTPEVNIISSSR
jgi:UDP-N-acetylmuramate dehydrogenase